LERRIPDNWSGVRGSIYFGENWNFRLFLPLHTYINNPVSFLGGEKIVWEVWKIQKQLAIAKTTIFFEKTTNFM